jgi:hypothetical protein
MDEYSDVDLVVAVAPGHEAEVARDRQAIAASLGPVLAAFTGEHVGEPRLLICLYGTSPILHVDLKFVALADVGKRVDEPAVLWERDGQMTRALAGGRAAYPPMDLPWIEDRFWVWVHYGATKIARGELFEAIDMLAALRGRVLGPLVLAAHGRTPSGVRRIEARAADAVPALRATLAGHDARACADALAACADLYRSLRDAAPAPPGFVPRAAAEAAARAFLADVVARLPPV